MPLIPVSRRLCRSALAPSLPSPKGYIIGISQLVWYSQTREWPSFTPPTQSWTGRPRSALKQGEAQRSASCFRVRDFGTEGAADERRCTLINAEPQAGSCVGFGTRAYCLCRRWRAWGPKQKARIAVTIAGTPAGSLAATCDVGLLPSPRFRCHAINSLPSWSEPNRDCHPSTGSVRSCASDLSILVEIGKIRRS